MTHSVVCLASISMSGLWVVAMLAGAALSGCRSVESPRDEEFGDPAPDDPRLLQMGLLYDDTIVTQSGRTVDFNGQALIPRFKQIGKSGAGGDLRVNVATNNIVLGVNRNFTVKIAIPYISKRLDRPGLATTLRSEGLGDVAVTGKYRFYQKTGLAKTTEAALLFGLELPTGRNSVMNNGTLLPAQLQPGSGSLDAIVGGAITKIDGRWLGNADLIAKLNSSADHFQFGNVLRADIGGQYRLWPAHYKQYDQLTVNLLAELNSVWLGRNQASGQSVAASGGFKLFATPGIQVIFNRYFLFEAGVQIPIVLDLNGNQLEEDYVAITGFRIRY